MQMKKVLYVWFKEYMGTLDGGAQVNTRNHALLCRLFGADQVDSYYIHRKGERRGLKTKAVAFFYTTKNYHNGITPQHVHEIVCLSSQYEYVFLSSSVMGIIARGLHDAHYGGTVISHFHNVESQYYDAYMPRWMPGRQFIVRCAANNDLYSCRYSKIMIVLNQRDADILEKSYGRKADAVLPVAMSDQCDKTADSSQLTGKRPFCLFMGSYFAPNVEGILWFVRNVLPHVDIRLRIVGKGMDRLKNQYPELLRDVEVIGDAPSLVPHFTEADLMVLPIFSGSGMKVKTCESLMHGKHILGTDETFSGYELDPQQAGALCNTAQQYIDAIHRYAEHPVSRFNVYSRQIWNDLYSEESAYRRLAMLFHPSKA